MDGLLHTGSSEWSCLSPSVPSTLLLLLLLLSLPLSLPKFNYSKPRHLGTCVYNVLYICG